MYSMLIFSIMAFTIPPTETDSTSINIPLLDAEKDVIEPCFMENKTFQGGEEITYKLYYNWGIMWLSAGEVTFAITLAAVSRSVIIASVSIFIFSFIIDLEIKNYFTLIAFTFLSSFILGALGIVAGLWAEKFDHMATVTNFIIIPLSFLSGTFYTIDKLPGYLHTISKANPFFYMIDGFRYSFLEESDGSITVGLVYLSILIKWRKTQTTHASCSSSTEV